MSTKFNHTLLTLLNAGLLFCLSFLNSSLLSAVSLIFAMILTFTAFNPLTTHNKKTLDIFTSALFANILLLKTFLYAFYRKASYIDSFESDSLTAAGMLLASGISALSLLNFKLTDDSEEPDNVQSSAEREQDYNNYKKHKVERYILQICLVLSLAWVAAMRLTACNLPNFIFFVLFLWVLSYKSKWHSHLLSVCLVYNVLLLLSINIVNIAGLKAFATLLVDFDSPLSWVFYLNILVLFCLLCYGYKIAELPPKPNKTDLELTLPLYYSSTKRFLKRYSFILFTFLTLIWIFSNTCLIMLVNFLIVFFGIYGSVDNLRKFTVIPVVLLTFGYISVLLCFNLFFNLSNSQTLVIIGIYRFSTSEDEFTVVSDNFTEMLVNNLMFAALSWIGALLIKKSSSTEEASFQNVASFFSYFKEKYTLLFLITASICAIHRFDLPHAIYMLLITACVVKSSFITPFKILIYFNRCFILLILYFWNMFDFHEKMSKETKEIAAFLGLLSTKGGFIHYWEHLLLCFIGYFQYFITYPEDNSAVDPKVIKEWKKFALNHSFYLDLLVFMLTFVFCLLEKPSLEGLTLLITILGYIWMKYLNNATFNTVVSFVSLGLIYWVFVSSVPLLSDVLHLYPLQEYVSKTKLLCLILILIWSNLTFYTNNEENSGFTRHFLVALVSIRPKAFFLCTVIPLLTLEISFFSTIILFFCVIAIHSNFTLFEQIKRKISFLAIIRLICLYLCRLRQFNKYMNDDFTWLGVQSEQFPVAETAILLIDSVISTEIVELNSAEAEFFIEIQLFLVKIQNFVFEFGQIFVVFICLLMAATECNLVSVVFLVFIALNLGSDLKQNKFTEDLEENKKIACLWKYLAVFLSGFSLLKVLSVLWLPPSANLNNYFTGISLFCKSNDTVIL